MVAIDGLLAAPFTVLAIIVVPMWNAPLFDRCGPMRDQALETAVHALAARAGIADSRIYEVHKSDETRQVNAYVPGLRRHPAEHFVRHLGDRR